MSEKKYYCFCASNCKYETMTKEQILAAIAQAAETGLVYDPDAAVVSRVKESNAGGSVTFWVGTNAQYNALESVEQDCVYIITDDTSREDVDAAFKQAAADAAAAVTAAANAQTTANAANTAAGAALPKAGGAMTGYITTKGIKLTSGTDYGTSLPAAGNAGRLFFKKVSG